MRSVAFCLVVTIIFVQAKGQVCNDVLHLKNTYNSISEIKELNINPDYKIVADNDKIAFLRIKNNDTIKVFLKPDEASLDSIKYPEGEKENFFEKMFPAYVIGGNGNFLIENHMVGYYNYFNGKGYRENTASKGGKLYDSKGKIILSISECQDGFNFLFSPDNKTFVGNPHSVCEDSLWFYDSQGKLLNSFLLSDNRGTTYNRQYSYNGNYKCWSNELYAFDSVGNMKMHFNFFNKFHSSLINFFVSDSDPNQIFLNFFGKDLISTDTLGNILWRVKNIVARGGYYNVLYDYLILNVQDYSSKSSNLIIFDAYGNEKCRLEEEVIYGNDHVLITNKGNRFYEYGF